VSSSCRQAEILRVLFYDSFWWPDFWCPHREGQEAIQPDLLYDYRTNLAEYPKWQRWLKTTQPKILLVWGRNDVFFPASAAEAIKRDVPGAELQVYDTSRLALEEHHADIAEAITAFLNQ